MSKKRKRRQSNSRYKDWITEDGLKQLEAWARDGLIDEQVAAKIGIAKSTLYNWKKRHPEIDQALRRGKEVIDVEVENSLLKRALGYTTVEVTEEERLNPDTDKVELVPVKRVVKEVLPDTTAQIFWLKNRKPDEWRDRKDIDANINRENNPFEELSVEALKKLADED